VLAVAALPTRAHAFCRATTCDENDPDMVCAFDERGCPLTGPVLWWRAPCITLWLPDEADPLPGIPADQYGTVVRGAFARWSAVDCGSGQPSIDARFGGELALECALTGYDQDALENVNTVSVVDENWPHPRALRELALTTLTFDVNTGEILDADIELNAAQREFSLGDTAVSNDLDGTLTHEAGHVLGLAHSADLDATMFAKARTGSTNLRTLEADDIAGICSIYPPEDAPSQACSREAATRDPAAVCEAVVTPRPAGRARGCAIGGAGQGQSAWWILAGALLLARRRSRQVSGSRLTR
jgi:hypothetical protein